jgi:hypothetical protein
MNSLNTSLNTHRASRLLGGMARLGVPALAGTAALLMAACASTPPPTDQMAVSTAAVAHAVGAGSTELAAADLKMARDKLDRAHVAMTAKDYDLARSLAQEAQVDAQLAEARANSAKAQKAADELQEGRRVLREEMERKAK